MLAMSRQILIFFLKAKTVLQMSLSTLLFHRNNSLETRRKLVLNFMPIHQNVVCFWCVWYRNDQLSHFHYVMSRASQLSMSILIWILPFCRYGPSEMQQKWNLESKNWLWRMHVIPCESRHGLQIHDHDYFKKVHAI